MTSLWAELGIYFGRFREFKRVDWIVYAVWVGMMAGMVAVSSAFLAFGRSAGVEFPPWAYLLPIGAMIFTIAIAVDTIGHRTIYKEVIRGGEGLVHHITIVSGIGSCVLLCLAYPHRTEIALPALVLTILSFVYSLIDEAMHWRRYLSRRSDVIEMWSHVMILIGHGTMMAGWWAWYAGGYQGVAATLQALSARG
jgi:hypothetical protein